MISLRTVKDVSSTGDIAKDPDKHISGQSKITKAATCVATGISTIYCGRCNKPIGTSEVAKDPNNHSSVNAQWKTITDSTCHSKGVKGLYCGRGCGQVIDKKEIDLKDHNLVRVHTHNNDCLTREISTNMNNLPPGSNAHWAVVDTYDLWPYTKAEAETNAGPVLANQLYIAGYDFNAANSSEGVWNYIAEVSSVNSSTRRSSKGYPQIAYNAYGHHGDPTTDNYYLTVRRFTITFKASWDGSKWKALQSPSWHVSSASAWVKLPGCGYSATWVKCTNPGCNYQNY